MTTLYFALKLIHVLGAALLFGTGLGIAFFMWMANRTRDPATIAATAKIVVVADAVFTASAAVVQPLSGAGLIAVVGYPWTMPWIIAALALYVFIGFCWLPVVAIQMRLRTLARAAAEEGSPLSDEYHRLYRIWFALGWPAFIAMLLLFADMVWKPTFW